MSDEHNRRDITYVDGRIREIFVLVSEHQTLDHEVNKDISNRLVGIETMVNSNAARDIELQRDERAWFRRLFWGFVATVGFHVATLLGLTIVMTRQGSLNDVFAVAQIEAQATLLRHIERFARIEADIRSLRTEFDRSQTHRPSPAAQK